MYRFSNNAVSTLLTGILSSDTSLEVQSGDGDKFAVTYGADDGTYMAATLTHGDFPNQTEIILLKWHTSSDVFFVERGAESTGTKDWPAGTEISARVTAKMLERFAQKPEDGSGKGIDLFGYNPPVFGTLNLPASGTPASGFVLGGISRVNHAWAIDGFSVLQHARKFGAGQFSPRSAYETVGRTLPVDLGVPSTWAASTNYSRASVVIPAVPNGYQYWCDIADIEDDYLTSATEPVFPAAEGDYVDVTGGRWTATTMPIDLAHELSPAARFVVSEVGFICHRKTSGDLPTISIGDDVDPTRYASAQSLSQITAAGDVHRILISTGGRPSEGLNFRVDTAATGGSFLGCFYFKGFYIESFFGA